MILNVSKNSFVSCQAIVCCNTIAAENFIQSRLQYQEAFAVPRKAKWLASLCTRNINFRQTHFITRREGLRNDRAMEVTANRGEM